MAIQDEDDFENYRLGDAARARRNAGHNAADDHDDPDSRDLVPDDLATLRCQKCRKWILETTERCPYCHHWQARSRFNKPLWFMATAIACIALMAIAIIYGWHFW